MVGIKVAVGIKSSKLTSPLRKSCTAVAVKHAFTYVYFSVIRGIENLHIKPPQP